MKLVTADQMRAIEQSSVDAGVSLDVLMENAGLAVAEATRDDLIDGEDSNGVFGARIVILVGPGNNGADGFVVGRHLAVWGANVTAVLCTKRDSIDPKRGLAEEAGVAVEDGLAESGFTTLQQKLETTDVVIDAVLGIGSSRPIAASLANLLFAVLESGVRVVALDLPTGLDSDTGEFDIAGLPADQTLMLGYPKLGPSLAGDPSVTGEQFVLDIGIPQGLDSQIRTELIDEDLAIELHPERPHDGHKGTFGSALVIGGSQDYLGAVTMTTDAASRSGCGLTFVATPESAYRQIAGNIPEAMYRSLAVGSNGNVAASEAAKTALELAGKSTSVTIGPGLGNNSDSAEFLSIFLSQINPETPLVLDADALNVLSGAYKWWERLENPAVLTPHPGEMGRLLGISTEQVQQNRLSTALDAAAKFDKTIVLKGSATLIASPEGRVIVSPWVNSGLAQGGSGDVLAGLIGGLIAQSPEEPFEMAALAVYIHGYAAHFARLEVGETGMRATDVLARLGDFYRDHVQS